ncbi:hypothetical protein GC197_03965 [bacterium]|nr:hypothetical protein [bacterium]
MRSNIINIRANFAAVVARVCVAAVDVIRNASAANMRLYGHQWQKYGPTGWFKQTTARCERDLPCDDLRCLGGSLASGSLPGGPSTTLSMRLLTLPSLGLIPRS